MKPPVPKKADWPNDSRPVKPNRMSKPRPNRPQIRIWFTVLGAKPSSGSTKGAAIRPSAVRPSTRNGRRSTWLGLGRSAQSRLRRPIRPRGRSTQHEGHRREQHDVGIAGIDHRGDAEDLAGDQAAQDGARERADAADHDHDEGLDQDHLAHVGRQRHDRRVDDAGEARGHGADTEHDHEDADRR